MMCSYEKSKYGPSRTMPALDWMTMRLALGGRELHRLREALLAAVIVAAVDVGVVHHGDSSVEGGAHQRAHLLVGLVLDAHQAEHHVGCGDVDAGKVEGLHVV